MPVIPLRREPARKASAVISTPHFRQTMASLASALPAVVMPVSTILEVEGWIYPASKSAGQKSAYPDRDKPASANARR